MNIFRRKGQSDSSGSQSSLALPSSNTPAQVASSSSNDAVSVTSKLFRRGKQGHTDTTGDVAATSGNKTANAAMILGIVQAICEVLAGQCAVRQGSHGTGEYSHHDHPSASSFCSEIAVLIHISHYRQSTHVRKNGDKVKSDLNKVRDIVFEFRYGRDDSARCPVMSRAAFLELESCLREVLEAVIRYQDVSAGRLALERSALKAEATLCVRHIDMAVKVFQVCQLHFCTWVQIIF